MYIFINILDQKLRRSNREAGVSQKNKNLQGVRYTPDSPNSISKKEKKKKYVIGI